MTKRFRNWCFTLNNYTEVDLANLKQEHDQVRYICFGKEVGEKTETPHLQGFVVFHNAKTFTQCRQQFTERFHIEQANGDVNQNIAYCSKDGDFYERGERPRQGKRNDIHEAVKKLKEGARIDEVILESTSYQSAKHIELMLKYLPVPPPVKRQIIYLCGVTGAGKTRYVYENYQDIYPIGLNYKWWQGYYGQKTVLLDDIRSTNIKFVDLLRLLDRYPIYVENKGGGLFIRSTTDTIIMTSAFNPFELFGDIDEDLAQFIRRLDSVKLFRDNSKVVDITQECRTLAGLPCAPSTNVDTSLLEGLRNTVTLPVGRQASRYTILNVPMSRLLL